MVRTLAHLTKKLSRDLSALEARCAKQMDEMEEGRDIALMEIGFAKQVLKKYNLGLAKAKAAHMKAVEKANEIRDKEIRTAEEKRRGAMAREERKNRQAKKRAFRVRQVALRKAKAKWRQALERIRRRPLSEQRALKKAADKLYEDTIEAARETYQDAIDEARLAHQSALQDLLAEERLAFERANRTTERMVTVAVVEYERAVAREETKMRSELAKSTEARQIQEGYDRRLSEAREACERKKEALFKKFTQDRKRIRR